MIYMMNAIRQTASQHVILPAASNLWGEKSVDKVSSGIFKSFPAIVGH